MKQSDKIYVAGHSGLVGSALVRLLQAHGFINLITRSRAEVDLRDERAVRDFFAEEAPEVVVLAAAKVGGIKANMDAPVEFLIENLQIQNNVIRAAHEAGARKLVFLGSSCIYPKFAPQPIPESALLSGPLEPTNEPYAIAKIAGIKLCQAFAREYGANFISVMPTNLYGPGDNFDLETSHALAALLRKAHEAKMSGAGEMIVWGTGEPRREFLHVDDLAAAVLFLLEEVRFAGNYQCWLRRRHFHSGVSGIDLRRGRFSGRAKVGPLKTERHPAQIARRLQDQKARLAANNFAAGRRRPSLRMVP